MEPLQVREFRQHLGGAFNRAQGGEKVLVRRKNDIYALIHVGREEMAVTPELQAKIDKAEQEYREGKCIECTTPEEITQFLKSML